MSAGPGAAAAPAPMAVAPSIGRCVLALAAAAFVSAATMRVADPLIPQIAADLGTTPGGAAIVATAFALAYGLCQLAWGPLGDRLGKFRVVAFTTVASAFLVAAPALARDPGELGLARALGGVTAAAVIPLSMAFIGDHVPYEGRQAVLARFLTGQITGVIAGQALGGILGELLGWRAVFLLLGGVYLAVGLWLRLELRRGSVPPPVRAAASGGGGGPGRLLGGYLRLLRRPWARTVLLAVAVEGAAFYGGLAFVGAFAHDALGLGYASVGLALAAFGLGGYAYALAARPLVRRLGEGGLARGGGAAMAAGFALALALGPPGAWLLPVAMAAMGLGFYMLHGTLQTNATQMAPEARGLAVSTFASALFLGQAAGVTGAGLLVDRVGYAPAFAAAAALLLAVGAGFARALPRRPAA